VTGVRGFRATSGLFRPLDGVIEFGASLRPVAAIAQLRAVHDPLMTGGELTYLGPWVRLIELVTRASRVGGNVDDRLVTTVAERRFGAIGFSVVAEALANFGPVGVIGVLFGIGVVTGIVDRRRASPLDRLIGGTVLLALLNHVRNTSVGLSSTLAVGALIVSATTLGASMVTTRPTARNSIGAVPATPMRKR
jgi:hypothetical protein